MRQIPPMKGNAMSLMRIPKCLAILPVGLATAAYAAPVGNPLTIVGIAAAATLTVKLVIVLLVLVSIASWGMLLFKLTELRRATRGIDCCQDIVARAGMLRSVPDLSDSAASLLVDAARAELRISDKIIAQSGGAGAKERIAVQFERLENGISRRISRGVSFFATVASVTPFVGLFGTVWGIMHSFIGIADSNSTSLAVVAPGIAEALLATAIGLGVAIPATVMYNVVGKLAATYRASLTDCSASILCLVSRDIERSEASPTAVRAPLVDA